MALQKASFIGTNDFVTMDFSPLHGQIRIFLIHGLPSNWLGLTAINLTSFQIPPFSPPNIPRCSMVKHYKAMRGNHLQNDAP